MASPTNSSARPLPYISAVSMWVMPRSSPARRASMARRSASRSPSIFQVPCPRMGTWTPVHPNARVGMLMPTRLLDVDLRKAGVRGHIGEDDAIAGLQAADDLDALNRDAAEA